MKLETSNFNGNRLENPGIIPVLFFATWCPFCTRFYSQFESALKGKGVQWAEADISDDEDPLWETFDINVVPTIIVFKDGELVFRRDGTLGRGLSLKAIDETLDELKALEAHVTH